MVMQGKLDPALKTSIRKAFLELKDQAILKPFRAEGSSRLTTAPTTSCVKRPKCSLSI
jgi:hypothetical protein